MFIQRKKRERSGIRDGDGPIRCVGHMKYVRGFMCAAADRGSACSGKTHAHHVTTRGAGGGDDETVPLCAKHHDEIHMKGTETFAAAYKTDLAALAKQLWNSSPHGVAYRREHEDKT